MSDIVEIGELQLVQAPRRIAVGEKFGMEVRTTHQLQEDELLVYVTLTAERNGNGDLPLDCDGTSEYQENGSYIFKDNFFYDDAVGKTWKIFFNLLLSRADLGDEVIIGEVVVPIEVVAAE